MDIVNFFESQRADYLKAFDMVKTKLSQDEFTLFAEPLDEEFSEDGASLFSFFRHDFLIQTAESDAYFNTDVNVNPTIFEASQIAFYNSIEIILKSFVWNKCVFTSDRDIQPEVLNNWYSESIEPANTSTDVTIKNVIHSLIYQDTKQIVIDFGSATTDRLRSLLQVFQDAGLKKIIIESGYE
jgi:hypothetical protein